MFEPTPHIMDKVRLYEKLVEAFFGCTPWELKRRKHEAWLKTPVPKFFSAIQKQFKQLEDGHFTMDDKAYIEIDVTGLSEDRDHENSLLFRSLFVLPDHRNQGLAAEAIKRVTQVADATGCSIIVVCSPFELQNVPTDVAERRKFWQEEATYALLDEDYEEEQQRMADRFQRVRFQKIAIPELLSENSRSTDHCFIYIPDKASERFAEQMEERLVA
jgi:GNAT superfamily N-acetyltransferase